MATNYEDLKKDDLRDLLIDREIDFHASDTKEELIAKLEASDEAMKQPEESGEDAASMDENAHGSAEPDPAQPAAPVETKPGKGLSGWKHDSVDIVSGYALGTDGAEYLRTYSKALHGAGFTALAVEFCEKDKTGARSPVEPDKIRTLVVKYRERSRVFNDQMIEKSEVFDMAEPEDESFKERAITFASQKENSRILIARMM